MIAFPDKITKLGDEGDVVKVMDLSSSKILNSVTCDVQLAKLIQIVSDSSCVRQIHAIVTSGGRTEPSGADTEYCSKGQARRRSHPCLWSGRECQQGHWDPRQDTQDIFKTGEDAGSSHVLEII